jgi:hypothetical protein
MYGKLKRDKVKKRRWLWENSILLLIGVFGFMLASSFHNRGIPQKWATAIVGALIPFGFVIFAFRRILFRWSFWVSLAICLTIHVLVIWVVFSYLLSGIGSFPILLWLPIMLVEVFLLLIFVKRIEEKLTGQHEKISLNF